MYSLCLFTAYYNQTLQGVVVLGVNHDGLHIINRTKNIIKSYRYNEVLAWEVAGTNIDVF